MRAVGGGQVRTHLRHAAVDEQQVHGVAAERADAAQEPGPLLTGAPGRHVRGRRGDDASPRRAHAAAPAPAAPADCPSSR